MMRLLPPWAWLLLLAILFVLGLFWARATAPDLSEPINPLDDARKALLQVYGFDLDLVSGPDGGLLVRAVTPGGSAERRGIRPGDRIMAVGDRSVWHTQQLAELLNQVASRGYPFTIMVARGETYFGVPYGAGLPPEAGRPPGDQAAE